MEQLVSEVPEEQYEVSLWQVAEMWVAGSKWVSGGKTARRDRWDCEVDRDASSWWQLLW